MPSFKLTEFRPATKGRLRGFAAGRLDFGDGFALDLNDLSVHQRGAEDWIGWPAKPLIGRDGQAQRGDDGKLRWSAPLVRPASREASDRLGAAIIQAIRHAHPDALGGGGGEGAAAGAEAAGDG